MEEFAKAPHPSLVLLSCIVGIACIALQVSQVNCQVLRFLWLGSWLRKGWIQRTVRLRRPLPRHRTNSCRAAPRLYSLLSARAAGFAWVHCALRRPLPLLLFLQRVEISEHMTGRSVDRSFGSPRSVRKKAGDHVYLDTVGVAAAFATMTRSVSNFCQSLP